MDWKEKANEGKKCSRRVRNGKMILETIIFFVSFQFLSGPSTLCYVHSFCWSNKTRILTYPNCLHVFFFGCSGMSEKLPLTPLNYIPYTLRGRNNIEWWRSCSTFFEKTDPEFTPSKFPLNISPFLRQKIFSTGNFPEFTFENMWDSF